MDMSMNSLDKVTRQLTEPLPINCIDFRIQSINNGKYATILAYKDARVDMYRLDQVVGIQGWQKDYKMFEGRLYCGVALKFDNEWVWKWDCGVESNAEKEKGQASDAFKRACFNWGIGRELYDYPQISVKLNENEVVENAGGRPKYKASWELHLRDWTWDSKIVDGQMVGLYCKDLAGKMRFKWMREEGSVAPSQTLTTAVTGAGSSDLPDNANT